MRPRRAPLARKVIRPRPPEVQPEVGYGIQIYAVGLCYASVCYPAGLDVSHVLAALHHESPVLAPMAWQPSTDETFRGGQPNPCRCNTDSGRVHRLFVC